MVQTMLFQVDQALAGTAAHTNDPWLVGLVIGLLLIGMPLKFYSWAKLLDEIARWELDNQRPRH